MTRGTRNRSSWMVGPIEYLQPWKNPRCFWANPGPNRQAWIEAFRYIMRRAH